MLIDTHAHLFDGRFKKDLAQVLQKAKAAGVVGIVSVGIDSESNLKSIQIAEEHSSLVPLVAGVGIQPNHVAEAQPKDWDEVVRWVETKPIVTAVGETGLDRYWDRTPFPMQEDYFSRHLELARKHNKVVIIHCREAEKDVEKMLRVDFEKHGPVRAVLHSYTGDMETAHNCLAMGLHVSFAGMITYPTAQNLRDMAKTIPNDRILVETDCPYLSPQAMRGKRNEPGFVLHTAEVIANCRGQSLPEFSSLTTQNARSLFNFTN
jgi:TatD DNase family protein